MMGGRGHTPKKQCRYYVLHTYTNKILKRTTDSLGEGVRKGQMTGEMTNVGYMHVQICQNENHLSVQAIYSNKWKNQPRREEVRQRKRFPYSFSVSLPNFPVLWIKPRDLQTPGKACTTDPSLSLWNKVLRWGPTQLPRLVWNFWPCCLSTE